MNDINDITEAAILHLKHYKSGKWKAPYLHSTDELFELHLGKSGMFADADDRAQWREEFIVRYNRLCSQANTSRLLKGSP